jgi:hypothetical protein
MANNRYNNNNNNNNNDLDDVALSLETPTSLALLSTMQYLNGTNNTTTTTTNQYVGNNNNNTTRQPMSFEQQQRQQQQQQQPTMFLPLHENTHPLQVFLIDSTRSSSSSVSSIQHGHHQFNIIAQQSCQIVQWLIDIIPTTDRAGVLLTG